MSQVIANTGGILGVPITAGTYSSTTGGFTISIPLIADPNPTDEFSEEFYYLGYTWNGIPGVIAIEFQKAFTVLSRLSVTQADMALVDRNVTYLFGNNSASLTEIGRLAEAKIRNFFRARGTDWRSIKNFGDLKDAAIYYALSIAYLAEIQATGDGPSEKARLYAREAESAMENAVLEVATGHSDHTNDGSAGNSTIRIIS
jgi:hypothetical protein